MDGTARLGDGTRLYRRLRFGTLAELSMLDLRTYRDQQVRASWRRQWREMPSEKTTALLRREISKEEVINDQIAYLLFDPTTLENERQSPFFYFIRENGGWKITTHLDSTFHQALERAIEQGEYKLPESF